MEIKIFQDLVLAIVLVIFTIMGYIGPYSNIFFGLVALKIKGS